MVNKPGLQGIKNRDIIPANELREQARLVALGRFQGRPKWWHVIVALIGVLLVAILTTFFVVKVMWSAPRLDSSKYQAVFLDDGKVFFGKLKNTDGAYITLENAYYTKSTQTSNGSTNSDQTALLKVGSESYGPEESIQISRSKILFWQNLSEEGQVAKAIKNKVGQ